MTKCPNCQHEICAEAEQSWIPCSERLPEVGQNVLVCTTRAKKVKALARFIPYEGAPDDAGWWDNSYPGSGNTHIFKSVTHWMPLPAGPDCSTSNRS